MFAYVSWVSEFGSRDDMIDYIYLSERFPEGLFLMCVCRVAKGLKGAVCCFNLEKHNEGSSIPATLLGLFHMSPKSSVPITLCIPTEGSKTSRQLIETHFKIFFPIAWFPTSLPKCRLHGTH